MDKKVLLLVVAAVCVGLYFYGSQLQKDNQYTKYLPVIGGLAFGLNTLVNLAHSEEPKLEKPMTTHQQKPL